MGAKDYRVFTFKELRQLMNDNDGGTPKKMVEDRQALIFEDLNNEVYCPKYNSSSQPGIVISDYTGLRGGAYEDKQVVLAQDVVWQKYEPQAEDQTIEYTISHIYSGEEAGVSINPDIISMPATVKRIIRANGTDEKPEWSCVITIDDKYQLDGITIFKDTQPTYTDITYDEKYVSIESGNIIYIKNIDSNIIIETEISKRPEDSQYIKYEINYEGDDDAFTLIGNTLPATVERKIKSDGTDIKPDYSVIISPVDGYQIDGVKIFSGSTDITSEDNVSELDGEYNVALEGIDSNILISIETSKQKPVVTIEVTPKEATIHVDETKQLVAITEPGNMKYTWSSDNPSVATVDANGLVTGVSSGKANIRATYDEDDTVFDECEITVDVKVPDVTIKVIPATAQINVGDTITLNAQVSPDGTEYTWSSSDTSKVTVDSNGKITGVALGEATISATYKGNKDIYGTCKVNVVESDDVVINNPKAVQITYTFTGGQDLDTATYIGGQSSYYGYQGKKSSNSVKFSGDDMDQSTGKESVLILKDNLLSELGASTFSGELYTNWFGYDANDATEYHPAYSKVPSGGYCDIIITAYDDDNFTLSSDGTYTPANSDSVIETHRRRLPIYSGGILNYKDPKEYYSKSWGFNYDDSTGKFVLTSDITNGIYPCIWASTSSKDENNTIVKWSSSSVIGQASRSWKANRDGLYTIQKEGFYVDITSFTANYGNIVNGEPEKIKRDFNLQIVSIGNTTGLTNQDEMVMNVYKSGTLIGLLTPKSTMPYSSNTILVSADDITTELFIEVPGINNYQPQSNAIFFNMQARLVDSPEYAGIEVPYAVTQTETYVLEINPTKVVIDNPGTAVDVPMRSYKISGNTAESVETNITNAPDFIDAITYNGNTISSAAPFTLSNGSYLENITLVAEKNNAVANRVGTLTMQNSQKSDSCEVIQLGTLQFNVYCEDGDIDQNLFPDGYGVYNTDTYKTRADVSITVPAGQTLVTITINPEFISGNDNRSLAAELWKDSSSIVAVEKDEEQSSTYTVALPNKTEGGIYFVYMGICTEDSPGNYFGYNRIVIIQQAK